MLGRARITPLTLTYVNLKAGISMEVCMLGKSTCINTSYLYIHTYLHTDPSFQVYVSKCVVVVSVARADTHNTTHTYRHQ